MTKKKDIYEEQLAELMQDLQRTRADFENYRKRVEAEKQAAQALGQTKAVMKLLPVIDTIERATTNVPDELQKNAWVKGISAMAKNLEKLTSELGLERIQVVVNQTEFDPDLHNAISMEDGDGEKEIIVEELQPGYMLGNRPLRPAMVRVTRV